eukprot:jgi/Ulvmu1/818/UM010_0192.1
MHRFSFAGAGLPSLRGGAKTDASQQQENGGWRFNISPKRIQPLLASITRPASRNPIATLANAPEFRVHKIVGDGRCMFRATVRSLALHKGLFLRPSEELVEAEQLRQACHDALCRTSSRSKEFPDARKQILYGYGDLNEYCRQLARPTFWGGEVEMMVITKMLKIPIHVFTPAAESGGPNDQFKVIAKFGTKYRKPNRVHSGRDPVCLLYTGGCHYDLLIPRGL